jgi:hypothetical protein
MLKRLLHRASLARKNPGFTSTIKVNGVPIDSTNFSLADLGLTNIKYQTLAHAFSNVGLYQVTPYMYALNPGVAEELYLIDHFNYIFEDGLLTIQKMPIVITPRDTTVTYGSPVFGLELNFDYNYNDANIADSVKFDFLQEVRGIHYSFKTDEIAYADGMADSNGRFIMTSDLYCCVMGSLQKRKTIQATV